MSGFDYIKIILPIITGIFGYLLAKGTIGGNSEKSNESGSWRNKYGKLIKVISLVLIAAGIFSFFYYSSKNRIAPDLKPLLTEQAAQLNKTLPVMMDRETELKSVEAKGSMLIYHYRFINTKKGEMDMSVFNNGIFILQRYNFCSDKKTSELISKGADIKAVYYTKDNEEITSVTINRKICN